ncbi:MAG TPA: helix-turn-helix domain-containing protein [Bryobacteraceae bacterium]|nr:helix-turn-helix domain-containing protein [Bryobacteraceae bacterium]
MKSDNPVRRLRAFLGLNQIDFGRLVGKSNATIRNYENGMTIPPEVMERFKSLAAEKGLADIALELSSDDWRVQTVIYPLKPPPDPPAGTPSAHARWRALVDAALDDPDFGPLLVHLLSAFERTKIVPEPKTRKAGKK